MSSSPSNPGARAKTRGTTRPAFEPQRARTVRVDRRSARARAARNSRAQGGRRAAIAETQRLETALAALDGQRNARPTTTDASRRRRPARRARAPRGAKSNRAPGRGRRATESHLGEAASATGIARAAAGATLARLVGEGVLERVELPRASAATGARRPPRSPPQAPRSPPAAVGDASAWKRVPGPGLHVRLVVALVFVPFPAAGAPRCRPARGARHRGESPFPWVLRPLRMEAAVAR
jgi:hypothetical protein